MTKMPKWFPFVLLVICCFELSDVWNSSITRNDLLFAVGIISWAIVSNDPNEVKE